ncbi:GNAT family protein [Bacillus carboniphilus]|uniref:GNAT family protein n=1 Tax=Bacillus carboniphilus TaxID=86663 RepID=A0ABP3G6J7_9BACI
MKIKPILTERLLIRELEAKDLDGLFKIRSNDCIFKLVIWGPVSYLETKKMLEKQIEFQNMIDRKVFVFGVIFKEELIGECFLVVKDNKTDAEIGYYFLPDYWGRGFATETIKSLLAFGFNEFNLHRIIAKVDSENHGSSNALIGAGFRLEGYFKKDSMIKGEWRDSKLYAMLENEWKNLIS